MLARVPLVDVDDLVQEVFIQAMRQVHTLRDAHCFGGWLATVTRNRANDYHRQSVPEVELNDEIPDESVEAQSAGGPAAVDAAMIARGRT